MPRLPAPDDTAGHVALAVAAVARLAGVYFRILGTIFFLAVAGPVVPPMSDTDHEPTRPSPTAGEAAADATPTFLRCPRCSRAGVPQGPGRCVECGDITPRKRWEAHSAASPVQPEETNGGLCRACLRPAIVLCPGDLIQLDPLPLLAALVALTRPEYRDHSLLSWVIVAMLTVLFLGFGARRLKRACVVACDQCETVRVGGRSDADAIRPYVRGRAVIEGLRRWLIPAFYFSLVTGIYAEQFHDGPSRALSLVLLVLSLAVFAAGLARRRYLTPPRRWWHYFLLR